MKLKCIKCGIKYNERIDYEPFKHDLCWNCGTIWNFIGLMLTSINGPFSAKKLNRDVVIHLDGVRITKRKK